jgi:ABC-type branched-subunit amino acid transport system substrate-binding protein
MKQIPANPISRTEDRQKFVRLASKRVSNALHSIQLIANLSNRSNYHYTDDDVAKILKALKRFEFAQKKQGGIQFTLE